MAPKRATSSKALAAAKPSKRARQEEPREDDFFLDSDNERSDDGSDEDVETAEQKRLRLGEAALPMAHAGGAPSGCQAPAPPARGRAPSFMNS